jgi:NAD(P)-dependent dehydrogenase (short-subunit alcohol dehydrogenase family)
MERKVVIITGGSNGLGRGTAEVFAREGWNVAIIARNQEKLRQSEEQLKDAQGNVMGISADVSDANQVNRAVQDIFAKFGRVDVLINNAAIDYARSIEELTIEQWDQESELT